MKKRIRKTNVCLPRWTIMFLLLWLNSPGLLSQKYDLPSVRWEQGKLVYTSDSLGNNIPDYSFCGYMSSNEAIPDVPVKVVIPAMDGDATLAIRKAIDYLSGLPLQQNGFRGAILLEEGIYRVNGRFVIDHSGIVLRGSGEKTIIRAAGTDRETLFRINGQKDFQLSNKVSVSADYVPVGSTSVQLADASSFEVGMQVLIQRPATQAWVDVLEMNEFGGETSTWGWRPGHRGRDIYWQRTIEQISGNTLILDAPLTTALDVTLGGGVVSRLNWPGRISNIGIENLSLESEYDLSNPKDENHCWFAITMENVQNAWVRQLNFHHFAGSAVALYETVSKVTVVDCISLDPVSEIAGQRRNTFFTMGQQTLFLRCYAEGGNHDFATGFIAGGPNAFVQCESAMPNDFSGAIDSWASGVLFDIVNVDGHALSFKNRGVAGQGAGWTAANSMMWQCTASLMECFAPPTAQNWAYGAWGQFAGNGIWYEANSHIRPRSLFFTQLALRHGMDPAMYRDEVLPVKGESTSSPTIEQAASFTAMSVRPPVQLKDFIQQAYSRQPVLTDVDHAISVTDIPDPEPAVHAETTPVELIKGCLVYKGKLIAGNRFSVPWWRGDARPYAAVNSMPAISRFVPGRNGHGYTDYLSEVVGIMDMTGTLAIDHNYGLWYDRRRDDHERVRRIDADVWPPFYEQPFSRSGIGEAWDRLSKYDLTKPNPWYWSRLREFAELAEEKGMILIHQNYFQHNIIEAGAHWVDSPWRTANNINNTGFPEPPPFAGDDVIYMAEQFYDITHPVRRELHRTYIRQCLDNFKGQSNVIQCVSFEFTGPLHFVEFWLDVIAEWEKETGEEALVALSTTKDVQDAILADNKRSSIVDIIDIRYWAYRPDGSVYAPEGGKSLAPRQHGRQVNPGNRSFESVYRAVAEYRIKYPQKAVIYSEGNYTSFGWAVFMGGGSMPVLGKDVNADLLEAASGMLPFDTGEPEVYGLQNKGYGMILYSKDKKSLTADLRALTGDYTIRFIDPSSGQIIKREIEISGKKKVKIDLPGSGEIVTWIKKK